MTRDSRDVELGAVAEQAGWWFATLEDDHSEEARTRFAIWLRESPKNVDAFLQISEQNATLGELGRRRALGDLPDPLPDFSVTALRASIVNAPKDAGRRLIGGLRWAAGLAALAIVAGGFAWTLKDREADWRQFASVVGEQRTIELEDGSTMYLSPGSEVDVRMQANERALRLVTGEAMFKVARDATRPFRVRSGDAIVQALGTQFAVTRHGRGDTLVSVVEGSVQVSQDQGFIETVVALTGSANSAPVRVTAGQETRVISGKVSAPKAAIADPAQAWTNRQLTFVNEPLATIAEQFNRYNHTKIQVDEAAVGERRYALSIAADDAESLMDVLKADPELRIEQRNQEIWITSRNAR